jgi:hypothetical protein
MPTGEEEDPLGEDLPEEASWAMDYGDSCCTMVRSSRMKVERTSTNVGKSRYRHRWRPMASK